MELQSRFVQGDLEAFEELFRQFQGEIYALMVRMVRDRSIAEDLTLDAFWRIYKARERFDPEGNFRYWARRIAANVAIDHMRRKRKEEELPDNLPSPAAPDPALQREAQIMIKRAFQGLPPTLQTTAALALIEERPYHEIAQILGTTVGAVKLRVFRAVRILRKDLRHLQQSAKS
jgi:RNA polymerase sigma-70 factor (ECF subfamily)